MTIGSCFAGVGGFDLAFSRCGATTAWTIEIDGNCNRLLEKRFPEALKVVDIRFAQNLPSVDIVCGGWPCQDLSVAGNRAGLAGQRSGLFYEFIRVIKEVQPAFVLFENVAGLLSSNFGRDLAAVLFQLVQCGYSGCYRILDAQHFGLAQRRRRIFGLFARGDIGAERCIQVLSLVQGLRWNPAPRREARQEIAETLGAHATAGGGFGTDFECAGGLQAFGCNRQSGPIEVAGALNACATSSGRQDFETETFIAHPELVPVQSVNMKGERKQNGIGENGDPMFTLTGRDQHAIALAQNQRGELTENDTAGALSSGGGIPGQGYPCVAFAERTRSDGRNLETSDLAYALTDAGSGGQSHSRRLMQGPLVRRLTPTECERLQGFPDGWTEGFSDSVRYRMLGNSVAVPVVEWIARRLMKS